jgi:hypothetical protein
MFCVCSSVDVSIWLDERKDRLCNLVVRVFCCRSRGPWIGSPHYQIFWEVVGLERGPLSLVSTIEELLGRKSSCPGLENGYYVLGDPFCWPRNTLYPQTLELTSPTSGGRSVCIVRARTKAMEFILLGERNSEEWGNGDRAFSFGLPLILLFI